MIYKKLNSILDEIKAAKGKGKADVVRKYMDDPDFNMFVRMVMDADRQYFIHTLPKPTETQAEDFHELMTILNALDLKGSANKSDKQTVANIAAQSPEADRVITCILKKDLKVGIGEKTIAGLDPDWIFVVPYERCSKEDKAKNVVFPALAQKKADGGFAYGFESPVERTGKHFLSRNGSGFNLCGIVEPQVQMLGATIRALRGTSEIVTIGEMVFRGPDGKHLDRQTSNGLYNKAVHGTLTKEEAKSVDYILWGWLTRADYDGWSSSTPYGEIWEVLEETVRDFPNISLVETEEVNSFEEAQDFYIRMRRQGYEGAILKDLQDEWYWGTSTTLIKLKNVGEGEFRILDAYEGEGKYEGMLGGVIVESEDGKIVCRMGSGFKDHHREKGVDWWKDHEGGIVTGRFTGVSQDKTDRETFSLENPRFVEDRFNEKTVADTLEYCSAQCN